MVNVPIPTVRIKALKIDLDEMCDKFPNIKPLKGLCRSISAWQDNHKLREERAQNSSNAHTIWFGELFRIFAMITSVVQHMSVNMSNDVVSGKRKYVNDVHEQEQKKKLSHFSILRLSSPQKECGSEITP